MGIRALCEWATISSRATARDRHTDASPLEFWDSLSGGRALQSGIFLVWTKHSGYAKSFLIR
jgi:hypothetical protein